MTVRLVTFYLLSRYYVKCGLTVRHCFKQVIIFRQYEAIYFDDGETIPVTDLDILLVAFSREACKRNHGHVAERKQNKIDKSIKVRVNNIS